MNTSEKEVSKAFSALAGANKLAAESISFKQALTHL